MIMQPPRVLHPDGRPMPFSESLIGLLANRPNTGLPFRTGQWLATLDEDALTRLAVLTEEFALNGVAPHHDDIILCAIQANLAEGGGPLTPDDLDEICTLVGILAFLTSIESLIRVGWIEIDGDTSLLAQAEIKVRITDLGWEHKDDIKRVLH